MIQSQIVGRLGKDATVNQVGGKTVINFNVAHSERFKDASTGELKSKTTWVECSKWGENTAVAPYLKAGTLVAVTGKPEAGHYTNKEGHTVATLRCRVDHIELLSAAKDQAQPAAGQYMTGDRPNTEAPAAGQGQEGGDLPF